MTERQHGYDRADQTSSTTHDDEPVRHRHSSVMNAPTHPIASGLIARKADANGVAHDAEAAVANAASSSGSALPGPLMRKFEASLGTDLSSVRVHTGSESATAASAVGARAYATGQDIHFGAGQYDPSSTGGQHLIAHEVAHTVQQRGSTATRQNKLEVSSPHDGFEHEADRAADAMITGAPASVSSTPVTTARKSQDASTGTMAAAGDEAQGKAWQAPLTVDSISVQTDRSRVGDIVKDIRAQDTNVNALVQADPNTELKYGPRATNTTTLNDLQILDTKLDVTNVDTTAFASQYRYSFADYQRLKAEAATYTTLKNTDRTRGGDPVATVGGMHENEHLDLASSVQQVEYRAARQNLKSAATHMNAKVTKCRSAANRLQSTIYKAKALAAAATGAEAAAKLKAVNDEIAAVAGGVSAVVKIVSAVGGLAGGGGATAALGTAKASSEAGGATIEATDYAKSLGHGAGEQVLSPEAHSKAALMKAIGSDAASVFSGGGDMAESLVTAIGKYANKTQIGKLQNAIAKAAAEEASFKAAGESLTLVADQELLQGEAEELAVQQRAFVAAKLELRRTGDALMQLLNKSGAKGQKQARAVMFLTDADRFMAQVESALSAGKHQQANQTLAAEDRKKLRGTQTGEQTGGEVTNKFYYKCEKIVTPGMIYGTNTQYSLRKVFVQFQDNGTTHQGGKGTAENDEVALKIATLTRAKEEVRALQVNIQKALNLGEPSING
jgi:Domain of unknown function (DUF4157)